MKRFLFLITLLTLMGGANSVKAIVLGDEITSLDGITDGTLFIISDDGTKAKYFQNSGSAHVNKNANVEDVPADAYCFFTLVKYTGGEVDGDNIYWIKVTDADGVEYPYGSPSGGYLNSVQNYADDVIAGQKGGWGAPTSALWKVTYDAEKGFSFQDVWKAANLGNSWLAIGNGFVAAQQYLKLYSKGDDPLAPKRAALQTAINKGNARNSFAKTTESWNALQTAITTGESVLENSNDADELTAATKAINDAIDDLVLLDGYTKLTKDMYYNWNSATAPTTSTDGSGDCDYVLFASTSQPYGNGGVPLLSFADLSTFDTFYILTTGGGLPRILLNRDVNEGQWNATEADSHLIDNTKGDANSWHAKYFNTSGGNVTVDLKQLATDKGFAHLHTIKTVTANVTVSDMLLYREITVGETGYATFGSLYKNAKPNGVTAYAAVYNSGTGKVELTEVTNVPAGKGVIIEAAAGSYAPTFDVDADDITSELKVSNGTVTGDGSTIYVLNTDNEGNNLGFYKLAEGSRLAAGKAYLKITDTPARGFIGIDGMELTGVNEVKVNKAVAKTGKIYNLNGQIVSRPTKGLYIIDGKVVSF